MVGSISPAVKGRVKWLLAIILALGPSLDYYSYRKADVGNHASKDQVYEGCDESTRFF